jgi:hypothetical protein
MESETFLSTRPATGENINPYYASKKNIHTPRPVQRHDTKRLEQSIVDRGRAFDLLVNRDDRSETRDEMPSLDYCGALLWYLGLPGTCSASHFRKMELEKIGTFPIDHEKVKQVFPGLRPGIAAAAQYISIANSMKSVPPGTAIPNPGGTQKWRSPTLLGIESLLQNRS